MLPDHCGFRLIRNEQSKCKYLTFLILSCNFQFANGQSRQAYVDSVNNYRIFVDSIINSFYQNPATELSHTIAHYSCLNNEASWGSGGSADLYQDTKQTTIYQLSYTRCCDSVSTGRTLYFMNGKIVLAIIDDKGNDERITYYRDDRIFIVADFGRIPEELATRDLEAAYDILRNLQQKPLNKN